MKTTGLLIFACFLLASHAFAQIKIPDSSAMAAIIGLAVLPSEIPFEFTSEEDNRLIKENDSLKYYVASGDTTNVVCINEETSYYQLINREHKVIAEGPFVQNGDKFLQDGKWTERYDNGKTKTTGSYLKNMQIGTWQAFYPNGKLQARYNFGIFIERSNWEAQSCLSGSYQAYYQNGKINVDGFFAAYLIPVTDTIKVTDPVTDAATYHVSKHNKLWPNKAGHWDFYTEEGELDKTEDYGY